MGVALGWGALAASSLVIGAGLALVRDWPEWVVGLVLAFGAGALISAVSYELAQESFALGDQGITALGLAAGALTFYLADGAISGHQKRGRPGHNASAGAGTALALGAFLDGIPEQLVLGIGIAGGEGVGVGLLVAIFVSNLPEAIGSASDMRRAGRSDATILRLWIAVAAICALATVVGYAIADGASHNVKAVIDGFAAGALIVMLVDSMIPEARREGHRAAGLLTTLGFAVSAALSGVS
jgi:ZIP family zinc transporter